MAIDSLPQVAVEQFARTVEMTKNTYGEMIWKCHNLQYLDEILHALGLHHIVSVPLAEGCQVLQAQSGFSFH